MAPVLLATQTEPARKGDAYYDVTTESLNAAKLAQKLDRMQVYAETGIRIDDEGHFVFTEQNMADLGIRLGNAMSAAIYGARGEFR